MERPRGERTPLGEAPHRPQQQTGEICGLTACQHLEAPHTIHSHRVASEIDDPRAPRVFSEWCVRPRATYFLLDPDGFLELPEGRLLLAEEREELPLERLLLADGREPPPLDRLLPTDGLERLPVERLVPAEDRERLGVEREPLIVREDGADE